MCDEITIAGESVSTNVANTIPPNVTSTISMDSDDKKLRYKMVCYKMVCILLVMKLLFKTAIIFYHYAKQRSKQLKVLLY